MYKQLFACSALVFFGFGCSDIDVIDDVEALTPEEEVLEIVDNLVQAGYPDSEIEVREDGTVIVGGDALVTLQASREMIGESLDGDEQFRQYRTTNLVNPNQVQVICVDGSAFRDNTLSNGLDAAIANYHNLNLAFDMVRIGGSYGNPGNCDATIVGSVKGQVGGVSGFPAGGLPYGQFQIGKGTANYGVGVVKHVITHELGHTIGFRHSDYYNRALSCGQGGNEGDGGVGAIHIAGTPQGFDAGSVMNSCFSAQSNGTWSNADLTALNTLY